MKRYSPTCIVFLALLIVAALVFFLQRHTSSRLRSVQIDGFCWDETSHTYIPFAIQIDDERDLAEVRPWRHSLHQQAQKKALYRLLPPLRRTQCENSLRQGLERVTLVYEDGRREELTVNIYATPFRNQWIESESATAALLFALRWIFLATFNYPFCY
jgi:hypothetical protein